MRREEEERAFGREIAKLNSEPGAGNLSVALGLEFSGEVLDDLAYTLRDVGTELDVLSIACTADGAIASDLAPILRRLCGRVRCIAAVTRFACDNGSLGRSQNAKSASLDSISAAAE
jgi:hypothetical protein